MKTKLVLSFALVGALVTSALSADYSKLSNEELIKLSSSKIAPKDYPDYKIEVHKRMQEMKIKEARDFGDKLRESRNNVYDKMTRKEYQEYREATRLEMQKRLDTMSESQARESGLVGYGYHRGYHDRGDRGYRRDCYMRGNHHL